MFRLWEDSGFMLRTEVIYREVIQLDASLRWVFMCQRSLGVDYIRDQLEWVTLNNGPSEFKGSNAAPKFSSPQYG